MAPLLLLAAARVTRPAAKALVQFYLDLKNDVQEEIREFESYKKQRHGLNPLGAHALAEGAQELLPEEAEAEAESSAAEALMEVLEEILT